MFLINRTAIMVHRRDEAAGIEKSDDVSGNWTPQDRKPLNCNHHGCKYIYVLWINSLTYGRCGSNFRRIISEHLLHSNFMTISWRIALRWMLHNFNDKSTLVQVMAGCHQAPGHYLSQCSPRSLSYRATKPQLFNTLRLRQKAANLVDITYKFIFLHDDCFILIKSLTEFFSAWLN